MRRAAGRLPIRGPGLRPGSRGQRARVLCSHLGGGLPDARSPGHARSEAAAFPVGGRRVLAGAGRRGTRHAARGAVAPWPGRNRTGRDTRAPCCPSHCAPQTRSLLKRVLVGSGSAGRGPLRSAYCPRVWRSRKRTPPLALPELAMLMNTEEQRGVDPETSGGSALRAELPAEAPVGHTAVLWMPARSGSCR